MDSGCTLRPERTRRDATLSIPSIRFHERLAGFSFGSARATEPRLTSTSGSRWGRWFQLYRARRSTFSSGRMHSSPDFGPLNPTYFVAWLRESARAAPGFFGAAAWLR